ncbi:transmembrane protein 270 [Phascolarctos cinereus]|uniref:Williams-Beuren syndrome chromosomal region 28 protein n=1 Tax=Phascolarctos cinereus TaxID=38626 RepID=A0A6P5LYW3_PHACI|nr:Williams-Beuren syndrome chromosomal region 28 protein [Phascolarctos cinereus]
METVPSHMKVSVKSSTVQVARKEPGWQTLSESDRAFQLFQNRIHLYNFLLLKIFIFNHWVSGLAQEAEGSVCLAPAPPRSCLFCPLGSIMRSLVTLWSALLFLALRLPGLVLRHMFNSHFTFCHLCQAACSHLGFFWGIRKNLLHYWLQSLLFGVLLVLLVTWRLCQTAHHFTIKHLKRLAPLDNRLSLEFLSLLKWLYWQLESTAALTSWHLAYVVTWTTCLASHMLQDAFEHTAQLAQAQEGEMDMLWEDSTMESLLPEELKALDE